MAFNLFPKTFKFYDLFLKQSEKLSEAASIIKDVFAGCEELPAKIGRVNQIEAECNELSRELIRQLSMTFLTPIDKEDIFHVSTCNEEAVNALRALGIRIGLFGMNFGSNEIVKTALGIAGNIDEMAILTGIVLKNFTEKKSSEDIISKLSFIKQQSNLLFPVAYSEIFEHAVSNPEKLLEIIKWTQIYACFEATYLAIERLSNIIEGISLKYA